MLGQRLVMYTRGVLLLLGVLLRRVRRCRVDLLDVLQLRVNRA